MSETPDPEREAALAHVKAAIAARQNNLEAIARTVFKMSPYALNDLRRTVTALANGDKQMIYMIRTHASDSQMEWLGHLADLGLCFLGAEMIENHDKYKGGSDEQRNPNPTR